jgi:hypothetical protein
MVMQFGCCKLLHGQRPILAAKNSKYRRCRRARSRNMAKRLKTNPAVQSPRSQIRRLNARKRRLGAFDRWEAAKMQPGAWPQRKRV